MKVKYDEGRLLRTALDAVPSGILILGRDGRIVVCNRLADRFLGGEAHHDDLAAWSRGWSLTHPDGTPCTLEQFPGVRALHGDICERTDLITRVPDQEQPVALAASAAPLTTPRGGILGAVVT